MAACIQCMTEEDTEQYQPPAQQLHDAMKGTGTNEERIFEVSVKYTPAQRILIAQQYEKSFGGSLEKKFKKEFSGNLEKLIVDYYSGCYEMWA